jgi:hypothetical protein
LALRGPQRPGAPGPKGAPLTPLAQSLLASGIAKTPAEARVMARALKAALQQKGFASSKGGDAGLKEQIAGFQQASGLTSSGKLDGATIDKLVDAGVLPESARGKRPGGHARADAKPTPAKADMGKALESAARTTKQWGDFRKEGGAKAPKAGDAAAGTRHHSVAHEQARQRVELTKDGKPKDLTSLLDSLSQLGFFGGGKGKDRLANALRGLQTSAGLPVSGRLDQATVNELVQRGVLPEGTKVPADKAGQGAGQTGSKGAQDAAGRERPQARAEGVAADVAARGNVSEQASQNPAKARADTAQGDASPDGRGVAEGAGDPAADAGRGAEGQGAGHAGEGGEGTAHGVPTGEGRTSRGDDDGTEDDDANAPAGDEDVEDERRGHANLDDDSDADEGYWEVPALSEQVREALERIERNADERGAATYSWDVTFFRPGVYGARQPAEPLWHVVVERAGAFDPVWGEAQQKLRERIADVESLDAAPSSEDFVAALRRARVREA